MKITETIPEDDFEGTWELEAVIGDETYELSFGGGEPEDNCLGRDLNDVYKIENIIHAAYEAGKRGEEYEYVQAEED